MKKTLLLSAMWLGYAYAQAQCNVTTSAPTTTITCGQSVSLSAFGQSTGTVILSENFNSGGFGPGWGSTPGSVNFSNPCSPGGVDGTTHAWMDNNTSVPRALTSTAYNLSSATAGVTICFDMLFAEQGDAAPCEGPDEPDEGIYLQYSTDGGATWIDIHYFDPNGGNDPQFTTWHNWCFAVPAAAITANTMFQWFQDADSGADFDHWGIDNVQIYQNDVNMQLTWLHDGYNYGVGNPGGVNPTPVTPTSTTTYTAQLTTSAGTTCTETITITVIPPVYEVDITSTPDTLCPGDCANITAAAQQIVSPHTTPTFENNEFAVVSSGTASVNINVQGLNTTSLTSSSITQVVINSFNFSGSVFCTNFGGCPCNGSTIAFGQTCNLNTSGFDVTLTSPGGCSITLVPANVATGNYTNTVFVPGGPAFGGTFPNGGTWGPGQPFSNLNGCNPNGVWTLTFNAPGVGLGFGTLSGWSISFDDPAVYAPVTYTWSPTTNMTGSSTLTPTVCPTGVGTTNYSLTVNSNPACPSHTESIPIITSPCNGCNPPSFTVTPPAALCAPLTLDLASTVSGTGANIVTYHATNADANGDINPLPSSVVSASGTYYVRVELAGDPLCFSVQSVNVTINPVVTVSVSPAVDTICQGSATSLTASGAGTYAWANAAGLSGTSGTTVNASPSSTTTYTVTGTSNSCTGDTTITITVEPVPVVSVTPAASTVCPNTPVNLTASGATTYSWSPGTDLSATSGATVTSTPSSTITYTVTGTLGTCTHDTTVTITVSNTLVVSVLPPSATMCPGGSVNLTASGATSYTWSPAGGLSSTSGSTVTASPASTTTYTVAGATGGCTGDTTITVTVSNNLTAVITGGTAVCAGDSVTLSVNSGTTWSWAPATGLSCTNCQNPTAAPASNTEYTVNVTSGSCTASATHSITVNAEPTVSVSPISICAGANGQLQASGISGSNYQWTPAAGLSCTVCSNPTANPANTSTYTVIGTDGNGCDDTTSVTVTVNPLPVISILQGNTTICPGGSDTLAVSASAGSTFSWSPSTGLNNTTNDSVIVSLSNLGVTTYTAIATLNNCSAQQTINVTVSNNFNVNVNPVGICFGDSAQLFANGGTSWNWSPATDLSCTTCQNPYASPSATTTYTVSASQGFCTASNTVIVSVSPNPDAAYAFSSSATSGLPQTITFDNNSLSATSYIWNFGDGTSSTATDPSHVYDEEGNYTVTLIAYNTNGCGPDTISYTVVIFDGSSIVVPNIFTPNGDQTNEAFEIQTKGISELTCMIYDRWGLLMAEFSGTNNPKWDGKAPNGNPASEGTYFYILKATGIDKKTYDLHGSLLLIK